MRQAITDLYDAYTHRALERPEFLDRLAVLAGSAAAAEALLPQLENRNARAATVRPDHHDLVSLHVDYEGGRDRLHGYLAQRRARGGPRPAVLVIHENRGLDPHIEDVTRRLALAGFFALAPDLLSGRGGTPGDEDEARAKTRALDEVAVLADLRASVAWLAARPESNGRVGCVGFCWGGGHANRLATVEPGLAAAVVYYGRVPPTGTVARIRAPLLLHYAGLDEPINAGIAGYEAALREAGKTYELHRYDGANHAFNNDTNPVRHDPDAAALAWERTLDFLDARLRD